MTYFCTTTPKNDLCHFAELSQESSLCHIWNGKVMRATSFVHGYSGQSAALDCNARLLHEILDAKRDNLRDCLLTGFTNMQDRMRLITSNYWPKFESNGKALKTSGCSATVVLTDGSELAIADVGDNVIYMFESNGKKYEGTEISIWHDLNNKQECDRVKSESKSFIDGRSHVKVNWENKEKSLTFYIPDCQIGNQFYRANLTSVTRGLGNFWSEIDGTGEQFISEVPDVLSFPLSDVIDNVLVFVTRNIFEGFGREQIGECLKYMGLGNPAALIVRGAMNNIKWKAEKTPSAMVISVKDFVSKEAWPMLQPDPRWAIIGDKRGERIVDTWSWYWGNIPPLHLPRYLKDLDFQRHQILMSSNAQIKVEKRKTKVNVKAKVMSTTADVESTFSLSLKRPKLSKLEPSQEVNQESKTMKKRPKLSIDFNKSQEVSKLNSSAIVKYQPIKCEPKAFPCKTFKEECKPNLVDKMLEIPTKNLAMIKTEKKCENLGILTPQKYEKIEKINSSTQTEIHVKIPRFSSKPTQTIIEICKPPVESTAVQTQIINSDTFTTMKSNVNTVETAIQTEEIPIHTLLRLPPPPLQKTKTHRIFLNLPENKLKICPMEILKETNIEDWKTTETPMDTHYFTQDVALKQDPDIDTEDLQLTLNVIKIPTEPPKAVNIDEFLRTNGIKCDPFTNNKFLEESDSESDDMMNKTFQISPSFWNQKMAALYSSHAIKIKEEKFVAAKPSADLGTSSRISVPQKPKNKYIPVDSSPEKKPIVVGYVSPNETNRAVENLDKLLNIDEEEAEIKEVVPAPINIDDILSPVELRKNKSDIHENSESLKLTFHFTVDEQKSDNEDKNMQINATSNSEKNLETNETEQVKQKKKDPIRNQRIFKFRPPNLEQKPPSIIDMKPIIRENIGAKLDFLTEDFFSEALQLKPTETFMKELPSITAWFDGRETTLTSQILNDGKLETPPGPGNNESGESSPEMKVTLSPSKQTVIANTLPPTPDVDLASHLPQELLDCKTSPNPPKQAFVRPPSQVSEQIQSMRISIMKDFEATKLGEHDVDHKFLEETAKGKDGAAVINQNINVADAESYNATDADFLNDLM